MSRQLILILLLVASTPTSLGLLHITEDALTTSRAIITEITANHSKFAVTYSSLQEANHKLYNISRLFFDYYRGSKNIQLNSVFVDDVITSGGIDSSSMSPTLTALVKLRWSEFNKFAEEIFHDLSIRYALDDFYEEIALSKNFADHPVRELRIKPDFIYQFVEDEGRKMFNDKSYTDAMDQLHELPNAVVVDDGGNDASVLGFLSINETRVTICPSRSRQSRQQVVFNLIKRIALYDAQIYATIQYALGAHKVFFDAYDFIRNQDRLDLRNRTPTLWRDRDAIVGRMKQLESEFVDRNRKSLKSFKDSMVRISRDVWRCDVDEYLNREKPREGVTYVKMRLFQKYVVNEIDLRENKMCLKKCSQYVETKQHGCYDQRVCAFQRPCNGTLWDCDNQIRADLDICVSDRSAKSRYDYIEVKGKRFGKHSDKNGSPMNCRNNNTLVKAQTWHRWFAKCSYCMCTCENSISDDGYFNLRPVTSSVDSNFVVVGARFQMRNQVTHLQIQVGELLPNGAIDRSSMRWRDTDDYDIFDPKVVAGKDYHLISWTDRSFCLDSVETSSPEEEPRHSRLVTGLRLRKADGCLKLEIRSTEFDFETGKLDLETSHWPSNNASVRDKTEINDNYETTLTSDQYLRFMPSALDMDAGQSTVPLVSIQSVQSNPPVPLAGVGVFLRRDMHRGDTLMIKLSTYDVEPHITL